MSQIDTSNKERFAPPMARVADVDGAAQAQVHAKRSTRFWAAGIDMLVFLVPYTVLVFMWPDFFETSDDYLWSFSLVDPITTVLVFTAINGYLLHTQGQTVGKLLLNIRIVHASGSKASTKQMLIRYYAGSVISVVPAVAIIFGVVDSLFIFRKNRRCLHDLIADTIVIRA